MCNHDNDQARPREEAARRFERFHRISWREALKGFTGAPERLHRYRRLHHRMLEDALKRRPPMPRDGE